MGFPMFFPMNFRCFPHVFLVFCWVLIALPMISQGCLNKTVGHLWLFGGAPPRRRAQVLGRGERHQQGFRGGGIAQERPRSALAVGEDDVLGIFFGIFFFNFFLGIFSGILGIS